MVARHFPVAWLPGEGCGFESRPDRILFVIFGVCLTTFRYNLRIRDRLDFLKKGLFFNRLTDGGFRQTTVGSE
jgi:hypothetical protein